MWDEGAFAYGFPRRGRQTTPRVPVGPTPQSPIAAAPRAPDPRSNPYYQQLVSQITAQGAAQAASTRAAIQQALIGFGLVPEGFRDQMGALDDTTRALIAKNTATGISGYARMLEAKKQGIADLINRLQARGLRRTGARGYGLRKNQLGFDRNFADAIASLLQTTSGYYGQYAQGEAERQNALASMLANVYSDYYGSQNTSTLGGSNPANTPGYGLGGGLNWGSGGGNPPGYGLGGGLNWGWGS